MFSVSTLIHEKECSLTDDIIDDIMEKFRHDPNKHVIMYHPDLFRVKRYLKTELNSQLNEYIHKLNGSNHFFSKLLPDFQSNILDMSIHQSSYNDQELSVVERTNSVDQYRDKKLNVLQFVWFLNDYDGTVTFGEDEHKVHPKSGKLIMYPLSWCIPVAEEFSKLESVLSIRGQIRL